MPDLLPKEFQFSHEFCFYLHDYLVHIIQDGERDGIFQSKIYYRRPEDEDAIQGLAGEELISWLEDHGYEYVVHELRYRQICVALLSDMCHFLYEVLRCSKLGKQTVAFALLRKPIKENLFYLEWLLAEPQNFLEKFTSGEVEQLRIGSIGEERKVAIIEAAMKEAATAVCDARLLYDLRYDKKCEFGFEELNQKANHLITTMGALKTEAQNFNFVFAIDDATRTSLWENLYSFLPLILFHAVQVVEALMGSLARRVDEEIDITPLRTITGFLLWLEDGQWKSETTAARKQLEETLAAAGLSCPACGTPFEFHKQNLTLLYKEGTLSCSSCRQKLDLLDVELSVDQTHINRGLILAEYNQFEEAEGEFRAALQVNPDNATAHVNLGVTLSMRGLDAEAEAEVEFRSAIRLAPEDADLHINLGSFLERQGRKEKAEREYRTALQIDSENAFAFYKLWRLLAGLGRKEEADAVSQKARQLGFSIEEIERSFSENDQ